MVDSPLSYIFNQNDPNVNQQLRQRIALAMMQKQRRYPKTFGEGLSAIGESLGEIGMQRRLEQADLASQSADKALEAGDAGYAGNPSSPPTSNSVVPSAPPAIIPARPRSDLLSTPPQPPSMLRSASAGGGGIGGAAGPLSPDQSASLMDPNPTRTAIASSLAGEKPSPHNGGDYNIIDAQSGMPPGPGRVQDAVIKAYPDNPDMQAYASQMAGKEQGKPGEVSSTGARGPWQFVPGTAKQYGLSNPDDPTASAEALKSFTADNAAMFERINGRPPTMADLAVMHQQGGKTGAQMIGGTGNASQRNLALNNVDPLSSSSEAVDKIKSYYGLPDRAVNPRDAVAQTMAQGGDPQPPPTQMAFNGSPSDPGMPALPVSRETMPPPQQQQQIQQAPPVAPPLQSAPPAGGAVAQGQPPAVPGYVPPQPQGPTPAVPDKTAYSPVEVKAMQELNDAKRTGNQYTQERAGRILAQEAEKRQYLDARNLEVYKEKLKQRDEAQKMHETARTTQAGRQNADQKAQAELVGAQTEARIVARSGMKPDELYKRLDVEKQSVDQAIKGQSAQALARKAIKDGVITGYGADMKIATAKFADWAFKNGLKGDLASNTEIMKAGLDAGLSEAIKTVNGEGGSQVSNTDVKIAKGIQGSDPNLQQRTIQTIMDRASEINFRKINTYENYIEKTLGGEPTELKYRSTHGPTAPADKIQMLYQAQNDPQKGPIYQKYFDEIYGPGAAELELARVQRLAARRARGG